MPAPYASLGIFGGLLLLGVLVYSIWTQTPTPQREDKSHHNFNPVAGYDRPRNADWKNEDNPLKQEAYILSSLTLLLGCNKDNQTKVLVGKIVKIVTLQRKLKFAVIVLKEYLPSQEYGQNFKAIIHNDLVDELITVNLQVGDRLALLSPAVFHNPAFRTKYKRSEPKYAVDFGIEKNSLMWFAKKGFLRDHVHMNLNQTTTSIFDNNRHNSISCSEKKSEKLDKEGSKNLSDISKINLRDKNQNSRMGDTTGSPSTCTRQSARGKDLKVQDLNPRYSYTPVALAKHAAKHGDLGRLHIIAVVLKVSKPLSTTSTGKFTIICKLIDESIKCSEYFKIHCFTREDTILKQIEQGDVLRLHRVQMEVYNGVADGRIFNSEDITLFKKGSNGYTTTAKKSVITEKEKDRAKELMQWYREEAIPGHINSIDIVSLSSFDERCEHKNILCKIVSEPTEVNGMVVLEVTDGTNVKHLDPSGPLGGIEHIVTQIKVCQSFEEFKNLKADTYVVLYDVKAFKNDEEKISLLISNPFAHYYLIDEEVDQIRLIKRRIIDNGLSEDIVCTSQSGQLVNNTQIVVKSNEALNNQNEERTTPSRFLRKRVISQEPNAEDKNTRCEIVTARRSSNRKKMKPADKNHENCIVGKPAEGASGKNLKTLYTLDNGNWSDATDELSEATMPNMHEEENTVVVDPANETFTDLIETLRSKYCSPRRLPTQELEDNTARSADLKNRTISTDNNNCGRVKEPCIVLNKILVDPNTRSHDGYGGVHRQSKYNSKNRSSNMEEQSKSLDDLEDASTVFNESSHQQLPKKTKDNKRIRLGSDSTVLYDEQPLASIENITNSTEKVSSWLNKSNPVLEPDELGWKDISTILNGESEESLNAFSLISSSKMRLKGFLFEVTPNPDRVPFDLISGYCHSGCRTLYLSSSIHWRKIDGEDIPFCPMCIKLNLERTLELMIAFQLRVLGTDGCFYDVVLVREHAENFLRCDVREFLRNSEVRNSRLQLLKDCNAIGCLQNTHAPTLDISVAYINDLLFVVNTRLKLPANYV